jgi:hypothetical protein
VVLAKQNGGNEGMEDEKELRLSIEELEAALKSAKLVTSKEVINEVRIEPGELVVRVVR